MSNIISLKAAKPELESLSLSNGGTDVLLDVLIISASAMTLSPSQKKLLEFLCERKEINDNAPGCAGFDLAQMPWKAETLTEDKAFICALAEAAQKRTAWDELGYIPNAELLLPWLERFKAIVAAMEREHIE